jgi:hypothetical protein
MVLIVGNDADVPASDVVMPAATALTAAELPLVVGDVTWPPQRRRAVEVMTWPRCDSGSPRACPP